ncbi:MAG: DUF1232 domain-containing protein [Rhodocyclaceae bacterium]|nr:DUF1232 domain-containing protein [Rhodocyclaceae bacterium]
MQKLFALFRLVRKDVRILLFALRHPRRPAWLLPAVAGLLIYLISPVDLIPETLPVIGVVDDLVLIPLVIGWIVNRLPPELRADASEETD